MALKLSRPRPEGISVQKASTIQKRSVAGAKQQTGGAPAQPPRRRQRAFGGDAAGPAATQVRTSVPAAPPNRSQPPAAPPRRRRERMEVEAPPPVHSQAPASGGPTLSRSSGEGPAGSAVVHEQTITGKPVLPARPTGLVDGRPRGVSEEAWSEIFPPDRHAVVRIAGRLFASGELTPDEAIRKAFREHTRYEWKRIDEGGHLRLISNHTDMKWDADGLPSSRLVEAWFALKDYAQGKTTTLPFKLPEDMKEAMVRTMRYCHPVSVKPGLDPAFFILDDPLADEEDDAPEETPPSGMAFSP
ncbi:hypothetical protein ACTVH1_18210 [Gluconobacter cerinus]